MDRWFDPSFYDNTFSFWPRSPDAAALSEREAMEIADRADYQDRWPDVRIVAQYGLYDDGGTGESLILPPDFPEPPARPGRPDSVSSEEYMAWVRQRRQWDREAERTGRLITHRGRLVWIVAFIGIVERHSPDEQVRLKIIDDETRRVLGGYQTPATTFEGPA